MIDGAPWSVDFVRRLQSSQNPLSWLLSEQPIATTRLQSRRFTDPKSAMSNICGWDPQ
jgi:hypothetical protein